MKINTKLSYVKTSLKLELAFMGIDAGLPMAMESYRRSRFSMRSTSLNYASPTFLR
jgi:hypothetical protein